MGKWESEIRFLSTFAEGVYRGGKRLSEAFTSGQRTVSARAGMLRECSSSNICKQHCNKLERMKCGSDTTKSEEHATRFFLFV